MELPGDNAIEAPHTYGELAIISNSIAVVIHFFKTCITLQYLHSYPMLPLGTRECL